MRLLRWMAQEWPTLLLLAVLAWGIWLYVFR